MENRLIKVEELEVGDEIMISCQSYFKYLKVLTPPTMSKIKVGWRSKQPLHANFRCTTRQDVVTTYSYTDSKGVIHNRVSKSWVPSADGHNLRVSVDLNDRQIWLVKRETI